MTAEELLTLLVRELPCEIDWQGTEEAMHNLNEYGQPDRIDPIRPGRQLFSVTLDQDAVEMLAALVERK